MSVPPSGWDYEIMGLEFNRAFRTVCVLLLLIPLGCGGNADQPPLGTVTGTIFLDGKPLDGAIIYFSPQEGGRMSEAMSDVRGNYELVYIGNTKGAKAGTHAVRVTTAYEGQRERVPSLYNGEKTELSVDVKPGHNELDIDLKTTP